MRSPRPPLRAGSPAGGVRKVPNASPGRAVREGFYAPMLSSHQGSASPIVPMPCSWGIDDGRGKRQGMRGEGPIRPFFVSADSKKLQAE